MDRLQSLLNPHEGARRRSVTALAIGLAVLALAAGVAVRSHSEDSRKKLARAASSLGHRTVRGRLDDFSYAPPSTDAPPTLALQALIARLTKEGAGDEVRGLATLLSGDAAAAAVALEADASSHPTAQRWNDVAVARLEQAADPRSCAMALVAADRALRLDPRHAPALFNRALALEALRLRAFAADAYKDFLAADGESGWAAEARTRLSQMQLPTRAEKWQAAMADLERAVASGDAARIGEIVRQYPQQARAWGETEWLNRWGSARLAGRDAEAAAVLAMARAVGRELAGRGETMLADAVAAIDRAAGDDALTLARAHTTYREGRLLYHQRRAEEALRAFVRAEVDFASAGSPMTWLAAYFRANAEFDGNRLDEASAHLESALDHAAPGHRALRAQVRWEQATLGARVGRIHEALRYWRDAAKEFAALGEVENATRMNLNAASALAALGRHTEAWSLWRDIFAAVSDSGDPRLLEAALNESAYNEMVLKRWDVAGSLLDLALTLQDAGPRHHFNALLWRSFIAVEERDEEALSLDRLSIAAQAIPDAGLREEAMDDARFATALSLSERDPRRADELFRSVIAWRSANRRASRLPVVRVARARVLRAIGDDSAALAELDAAVETLETQRRDIGDEVLRDSFLASRGDTFEEAADVALALGDEARAFAFAEQGHGRALERLGADVTRSSPADVSRAVGAQSVLIEYVSTARRTALLVVGPRRLETATIPVGADALRDEVASFTRAIAGGDRAGIARHGRQLHQWLLAPALRLANAETVVVVPNDSLSGLPFAALQDETGRFVVESRTILVAPSASAYASRPREAANAGRALFIVPSAPAFLGLPPLPHAAAEAREAAAFYGDATVLEGAPATARRVVEEIGRFDVVHFGAHALPHPADPLASAIATSGDRAADLLYGRTIASLRLPRAPVVVLAACGSAAASTEGRDLRSIASAFVAAGSRSVIGTLWDVGDARSRMLTVAFHRELRAGRAPAIALRSAQLSLLHSNDERLSAPRTWSAYQVYGFE